MRRFYYTLPWSLYAPWCSNDCVMQITDWRGSYQLIESHHILPTSFMVKLLSSDVSKLYLIMEKRYPEDDNGTVGE
jgi:hypothetical protein